jgi:hypothetical protein
VCAFCRSKARLAKTLPVVEGSGEPQGGAPEDRVEGSGEPQGGAPVDHFEVTAG